MKYIERIERKFTTKKELHDALSVLGKHQISLTDRMRKRVKMLMQRNRSVTITEYYWNTSDGRRIAFKDLDPMHLVNIIRLIERKAKAMQENYLVMFDKVDNLGLGDHNLRRYLEQNTTGFKELVMWAKNHKVYDLLDAPEYIVRAKNVERGRDPQGYALPTRRLAARVLLNALHAFDDANRHYRGDAYEDVFEHDSDTAYGVG